MATETKPWIAKLRESADSLDQIPDEQLERAQSNRLAAARYRSDLIVRNWERGIGVDMETYGKWIAAVNEIANCIEAVIGTPEDFAKWQKECEIGEDSPSMG